MPILILLFIPERSDLMQKSILIAPLIVSVLMISACERFSAKAPVEVAPAPPVETVAAEPVLPVRPASAQSVAAIDWDAARRDLAARPPSDLEDIQVATGGQALPVPLMMPGEGVVVASGDVNFQPLKDGYFANFPGAKYNMIINGTNLVAGPAGAATTARTAAYRFLSTATGAQVAFSKYGADYLVDFECNEVDETGSCITEEEALAIVRGIDIAGAQ